MSQHSGRENLPHVLIIFVVAKDPVRGYKRHLVNEKAFALPRTRQDLSGAVQDVSWSRLYGCRLRAEPGRRRGRGGRRAGTADPGRGGRSAVSWSRLE
jgi:hypothetical protein